MWLTRDGHLWLNIDHLISAHSTVDANGTWNVIGTFASGTEFLKTGLATQQDADDWIRGAFIEKES